VQKLLRLDLRIAALIYLLADVLCVGLGMGVPIFCILLGFPVGWYIVRRASASAEPLRQVYFGIWKYAIITSGVTFVLMAILWGSLVPKIWDPDMDFQNFGHPFILFDPRLSFIAWLVLMIFISPFLQLLATVFGSFVTLLSTRTRNTGNV